MSILISTLQKKKEKREENKHSPTISMNKKQKKNEETYK